MSTAGPQSEPQSFAETALRLGGKSEEEATRLGTVDRADEQVEALFAARHQTVNSPVHQAVWSGKVPLELFTPAPPAVSAECEAAMEKCLEIAWRRRRTGVLYDEHGKVSEESFRELGAAGYWGMLIAPEYGGRGAPFARFACFLTRMATIDAMTAGLASVHGCIGAVDPVRTFGTEEQKRRLLPPLASGERLSGFALTEPAAGSDLTALRTVAVDRGDHFEITGEKLFITNAIPGRMVGLVALLDGRPAVFIAELPRQETAEFRLKTYGIHALRQAHNNGLIFDRFRVPRENLLKPRRGDGLTIAYHGLNLGRVSLCATAAGSMRVMLANMIPWAKFRRTYGQPIATRELVKRRLARLAALITGADALTAWCGWLIDEGYRGELECIVAKIFGSEAMKEAAIELFMKTHGGRAFLHGHLFGDNVHDYLAPSIYEGEGEMLGMAFFKSLVKEHGKAFLEPLGQRMQQYQMKKLSPWNPIHVWRLRREMWAYGRWMLDYALRKKDWQIVPGMSLRLKEHVRYAVDEFGRCPGELSRLMRKHQLQLADRQCRIAEVSQRIQDLVVILATAIWGHLQRNAVSADAADLLCQDLIRRRTGERPSDRYFKEASRLGEAVMEGGFTALAGVAAEEIMMPYAS